MTWPRATRNLKHADAGQLTAMQDAAAVLLEHERHISPDVITALCQIREETSAELKARGTSADPTHASACAPSSSWAAGQLDARRDSRELPAARYRHQEPRGYLRYVAFSSRSALDVGNGEESRA